MYLDSHCHINDEKLLKEADLIIKEAKEAGIDTLLVIGWDVPSSRKAVELASKYDGVFAAVGIHPENLEGIKESDLDEITELAKHEKVIAIGESGLDYYWDKDPKHHEVQKEWFIKQIALANEMNLPITIHARDAVQDVLTILKEHPLLNKGVMHCYSGSTEQLKEFEKLGFYFGFDGPITYKNSVTPKENVKACRLDRILSETDCPYLTPVPFRGQTNFPKYIPYIVEEIANLKGFSIDEIKKQIRQNFNDLFHVKQ